MRSSHAYLVAAGIGLLMLAAPTAASTQPRPASEEACNELRRRIDGHAKLSEGVRRAVAAKVASYPAAAPAPAAPAPAPAAAGRADAIRQRLSLLTTERKSLEDQRLGAMMRFDLAKASEIQGKIDTVDREKADLERELAGLSTAPAAPAPPTPAPAAPASAASDASRVRCEDVVAVYDETLATRRRELGAAEKQPGALPLLPTAGRSSEEIARELAAQFTGWPGAASQVGLLDQDGNGRLDGIVDVPVEGVYRLYRQRGDGSLAVDVFVLAGRGGVGEQARRLEEQAIRQAGLTLADLLTARPAGPVDVVGETRDFGPARAHYLAGNFADAGKLDLAAARSVEFKNWRGEEVRVLELYAPAAGGVARRSLVVRAAPQDQELVEEIVTQVRPASYWRTDVEMTVLRETRSATGAVVGQPVTRGPVRFSIER